MDNNDFEETRLQEKFRQYYAQADNKRSDYMGRADFGRRGGFFRKKRRKQLLGLLGKFGGRTGENTMAYFWNDVTVAVETALIDLLLFIRTGEDIIHEVINKKTFQPIIEALFFPFDLQDVPKPDSEKAKIALMMVENGLKYLKATSELITHDQIQTFKNTIQASRQLTALQTLQLPKNERDELFRSDIL